MKLILAFFILVFLTAFCSKTYCQKNEIGISLQTEKTPQVTETINPGAAKKTQPDWHFSFGLSYERTFHKRAGFETGLKYRRAINDIAIPVATGGNGTEYVHYSIIENFFSLPVLYKYRSRVITLSSGLSFDYLLSWKEEKEKSFFVPLASYKPFFNRKIAVGLLAGVSKKLLLYKKLSLEPGIYYNPVLSFKRSYYGVSIATRYQL